MAATGAPLRLMLYDRTCGGTGVLPGLTTAWRMGGVLYRALRRIDDWYGAATWAEGLDWLIERSAGHQIAEIQFWGHGEWGCVWIEEESLDAMALQPGHIHHERLLALRTRLVSDGTALWWFRTCETFGKQAGHDFARAWTRFFHCRAAGHTHTINFLQSGLYVLGPDDEPTWPADQAVVPGEPRAKDSSILAPHTITALHGTVPRSG